VARISWHNKWLADRCENFSSSSSDEVMKALEEKLQFTSAAQL